jgi:hypothetical protein
MSSGASTRTVLFADVFGHMTVPGTVECARPRMWPISCRATVSTSNSPAAAPSRQVFSWSSKCSGRGSALP